MFHEHEQCKRHWFTTTTTTKAKKKNRRVKTRKAANQTDKGQQNTIKPNPLSSLTFLKRHRLTLFQYYHPCQKSKFHINYYPKKKKKKNPIKSSTSFTLRGLSKQKKGESLYSNCVSPFGCGETLVSIFLIYFNFGFCIEFLIELLKKIKALLFFEIELVYGIRLYF